MIARWLWAIGAFLVLFGGLSLWRTSTEIMAIYYEALTGIYLAAGGLLALTKREIAIAPGSSHIEVLEYVRSVLSTDERFAGYFIILAAVSGLCMSSIHLYDAVALEAHHEAPPEKAVEASKYPPSAVKAPIEGRAADAAGQASSSEARHATPPKSK